MTDPKNHSGAESGRTWPKWIFWIFAGVALLYLVIRADSSGNGDGRPR